MPIRQPPSEAELAAGKNESGESTNDLDRLAAVMKIDLFDIRSFRESRPAHGRITITFSLRDGSGKPPMELPTDSYQQLVGVLQDRLDIERYVVTRGRARKLRINEKKTQLALGSSHLRRKRSSEENAVQRAAGRSVAIESGRSLQALHAKSGDVDAHAHLESDQHS